MCRGVLGAPGDAPALPGEGPVGAGEGGAEVAGCRGVEASCGVGTSTPSHSIQSSRLLSLPTSSSPSTSEEQEDEEEEEDEEVEE